MTVKEVTDYIYKSLEHSPIQYKGNLGFTTGKALGLLEGFSMSGTITKEESSQILRDLFESGII